MRTVFAWLVHLYTALGLVCAAAIAMLIVRGGDMAFRRAFFLMMIATAIDATDGWLARKARVREVLPGFDGGALDDLIDFHTYTSLPLLLIWRSGVLTDSLAWLLLLPLLASAYGFSQVDAKTDDGFFLGFPSYWNIVAFYLYAAHTPPWLNAIVVAVLAFLVFVPIRYVYPTRTVRFRALTNMLGGLWVVTLLLLLWQFPTPSGWLVVGSLYYPLYYTALSFYLHATEPASSLS